MKRKSLFIICGAVILAMIIAVTATVIVLFGGKKVKDTIPETLNGGSAITKASITERVQDYRPQLHFTPIKGYMNDPNGLIYNANTGEYHLYYQYQPESLTNEGKHIWGHAVSTDLLHWNEKDAVLPYVKDDVPASGSAVVDKNNTSGLFSDSTPAEERMVIVYTMVNYSSNLDMNREGNQQVGLAYSSDGGYTYTKYKGNPVIKNPNNSYGEDFRDPKVIWVDNQDGGTWLMIIGGGRLRLFTSPDLIHWTYNSSIDSIDGYELDSECPDLFPIALYGKKNETKWVMVARGQFYIVGDLQKNSKGKYVFKAQTGQKRIFNNASQMNASQTFYNDAQGRRIMMSWVVDTTADKVQHKVWNGIQSLPVELTLKMVNNEPTIVATPIKELESLRAKTLIHVKNKSYENGDTIDLLDKIEGNVYEIDAVLSWKEAVEFGMNLRTSDKESTALIYDGLTGIFNIDLGHSSIELNQIGTAEKIQLDENGELKLKIVVDNGIIEVWANNFYYAGLYFPSKDAVGAEMFLNMGALNISQFSVYALNSIW